MRRVSIRWIAMIVLLTAVGVDLSWLLGNRHIITPGISVSALGESLAILGATLAFRRFWPKSGQVDRSSLVFMAVATLPFWLVAIGARWHIRWRLVANAAWGTLLVVSLTSVVAALLGDSVTALGLAAVAIGLNCFGNLIIMVARLPAERRQR